MKIIESYVRGKEDNPNTCEDGLVINNDLVAVIDGVTAKGSRLWGGKKSGRYAMEILSAYLEKEGVANQSAEELITNLDDELRFQCAEIRNLPPEDHPRACIIIYNDIYREVWSYGDCQCLINELLFDNSKEIDKINAGLRAFVLEYELINGSTMEELRHHDTGREYIRNNLLAQFSFENKLGQFGYPVINGRGINACMIKHYTVHPGDIIVLASDGYPRLRESLQKSEDELSAVLEKDPLCFRSFHSTKGVSEGNISFDDRAYCKFIV